MKKRWKLVIPVVVVPVVAAVWFLQVRGRLPEAEIRVSGTIEATVVQAAFQIPGRLADRLVDEGHSVVQGQRIGILDNRDQKILVNQAEANYRYAESVVRDLEAGSRPEEIQRARSHVDQARHNLSELVQGFRSQEIEDARFEVDRAEAARRGAEATLEQAEADYRRYESLYREGGVSRRDYEIFRTRYETARTAVEEAAARAESARERLSLRKEGARPEQIERARAMLRQAEAEYALVREGPRSETIEQARARLAAARESLEQAKRQLAETELFSPITGVVLSKSAEPGEFLPPGSPVLVIGDLVHPWLRAYVNETRLGEIRLDQEAVVTTDSYQGKSWSGRISFIAGEAEFTPKTVQTAEERVKLMFRIKIDLSNPGLELKPGMPADAVIHPEKPE